MKYKILLLDADGTLLDFKRSEEIGLTHVFEEFQIPNRDACRTYYLKLNEILWKGFEEGSYPKQVIFDTRFQNMLDHFHIAGDGKAMEHSYRAWLDRGSHLIPHALDMVKKLSRCCSLYIITNGVSKTQHRRLSDSGLRPYFQDVFVSEDIGFQKPKKEYFDYVLNHIQGEKADMLVIGDSLHSDILGANQAEIASCWFHEKSLVNTTDIHCDYEITSLEELWNIVT